jgi:hypothetical protein
VNAAGFSDIDQEREMRRIDQGVVSPVCIKPP